MTATILRANSQHKTSPSRRHHSTNFDRHLQVVDAQGLLSHEDEIALGHLVQNAKRLQSQLDAEERTPTEQEEVVLQCGESALEKMVCRNIKLVVSIAKTLLNPNLTCTIDDLVQAGSIGLRKGCRKFDPTQGCRLSTYVYYWIRQEIIKELGDNGRTIRLPIYYGTEVHKIRKTWSMMRAQKGATPKLEDVAAEVNMPAAKVRERLVKSIPIVSLDQPKRGSSDDGKDASVGDFVYDLSLVGSPEDGIYTEQLTRFLARAIASLEPHQQDVLMRSEGFGRPPETLAEIAQTYNVSRQRVQAIKRKALNHLRVHFSTEAAQFFS